MKAYLKSKLMKKRPFIILTNPRSGSSWLTSLLRSRDDFIVMDELFHAPETNTAKIGSRHAYDRWNMFLKEQNKKKIPFLTLFKYLNEAFEKGEHAGFKLMFLHILKAPSMVLYIILKQVRIVHLYRENTLDNVISMKARMIRQCAHSDNNVQQIKMTLPPLDVLKELKKQIWIERATWLFCKFMPVPVFTLSYEQLVSKPKILNDLQKFLSPSTEIKTLTSTNKKLNTDSKSQMIENYAEIKELLMSKGLGGYCD